MKRSVKKTTMGTTDKSKRFHGRAFVSVISGFSFLGMAFTGAMLFVTPPGRIAHWTGWTLLGLGKEQWAAQHMLFSLVFFVAALIHLFYTRGHDHGLDNTFHAENHLHYPLESSPLVSYTPHPAET